MIARGGPWAAFSCVETPDGRRTPGLGVRRPLGVGGRWLAPVFCRVGVVEADDVVVVQVIDNRARVLGGEADLGDDLVPEAPGFGREIQLRGGAFREAHGA